MADGACYEIWCLVHSGDTRAQGRQACQGVGGPPSTDCITLHFFFNLPSPNFVWPGHLMCDRSPILGSVFWVRHCQYCGEKNTNVFSFDGISVTVKKNPYQRKNSHCNFQNYQLISLEYVEMFRKFD